MISNYLIGLREGLDGADHRAARRGLQRRLRGALAEPGQTGLQHGTNHRRPAEQRTDGEHQHQEHQRDGEQPGRVDVVIVAEELGF